MQVKKLILFVFFLSFLSTVYVQGEGLTVTVSPNSVFPGSEIKVKIVQDKGTPVTGRLEISLSSSKNKKVRATLVGRSFVKRNEFYVLVPFLGDVAFESTLFVKIGSLSGQTTLSYNPTDSLAIVKARPTLLPNTLIIGYRGSIISAKGININPSQITRAVFVDVNGQTLKTVDTSNIIFSKHQISFNVPNITQFLPFSLLYSYNALFAFTLEDGTTSNFVPFYYFSEVKSMSNIQISNVQLRKGGNQDELVITGTNLNKVSKVYLASDSGIVPPFISVGRKNFCFECEDGKEHLIVPVDTNIRGYTKLFLSNKNGSSFSNIADITKR